MKAKIQSSFTAIIRRSEKYWVALCPQLDVVSQGKVYISALEPAVA
ncbi:MAG: hypothetical protein ACOYMV_06100 [Verrucomicrobiia bacterium]